MMTLAAVSVTTAVITNTTTAVIIPASQRHRNAGHDQHTSNNQPKKENKLNGGVAAFDTN